MSQSAKSDAIRIMPLPPHLVDAMWPHVVPWLTKGLTAATTLTLEDIHRDVKNETDQIWMIFENESLVGAFVSAVYLDQGAYLGLYALGGKRMRTWAKAVDDEMQKEAVRRGLIRIRFAGREPWARVLPGLIRVGTLHNHAIWERAA
jgi:hypothetical protein